MSESTHQHYVYGDYLKWAEGERVELIVGNVYAMTPAPSRRHQVVLLNLGTEFNHFLKIRCRSASSTN